MTDTKQPEALRLSEWLDHHGERTTHSDAADELRRQHAEIEALQDDLAHKDDYAEQLGRELAKADSVIKELRAKLDELEEQEPYKYMGRSGTLFNERIPGIESKALYLAAGARPVEPVQKLRPDFIAGYDAGMADAKRIQAAQPAPGAGDQVQMILKHRLIRKVEGDWLAASEFMTGEPDPSWLAKTEESPEEWRIEQARRVSGEQIQAGLTRAFASWKKPAPAAAVGPNWGALRHSANEWADMAINGLQWLRNLSAGVGNVKEALANMEDNLKHCNEVNDDPAVQAAIRAALSAAQPAPAAQADAKDAARYRWLRDPTTDVALVLDKRTGYVPADEQVPGVGDYYTYEYRAGIELDAAIDAAIAAAIAADKKEQS